ncbi:hypothetical protein F511_22605 [Dorcoceras hygrometricum]|uniref:Uncharacterized protein n=1 Tax=Dorcoceras hygrometricum TaxID=472368 RepID=A0A2Z7CHJ8_9LAMI|nr:hypothetical protein F511_22605 [Dorcoceras hygrometricum]
MRVVTDRAGGRGRVRLIFKRIETTPAVRHEGGESQGVQPTMKMKTVNKKKKSIAAEPKQKKQKVPSQSVETRRQVDPTNINSEESSEEDSCPLVGSRCKRKQVTESSDSKSTISFHLNAFAKRMRTQRPQTQQRSAGDGGNFQYGSFPTIPVEGEGTFTGENLDTGSEEHDRATREQDAQMFSDSQFDNQGCETQMDSMNPNDKESDSIQDEPDFSSAKSFETETNHSERAIVAHSDPRRQAQPTVGIGRDREVSKLFERRSLIMYKLFEMEVEKVYHELLSNFKLDAPSVNFDYFFIRRLHKELKVIATVHKNHLAMADLPIADEEISFLGFASAPPLALEFSSLADQEQAAAQTRVQQLDQPANENTTMISPEHPNQENETPVQTDGHQAEGN